MLLGKRTVISLVTGILGLQAACGLEAPESPDLLAKYISKDQGEKPGGEKPNPKDPGGNTEKPAKPLQEIKDADVLRLIEGDIEKLSPSEQKKTRYFTLHVASNAGYAGNDLETQRLAFRKVLNSISTKSNLVKPAAVDADKIVYRVNVEDIGMSPEEFDRVLTQHYPFQSKFRDQGTAESLENETNDESIRRLLDTNSYLIRMDWWNATAALPILYAKFMRFPKNQSAFEEIFLDDKVPVESLSNRARRNMDESVVRVENEVRMVDARIANILNDDVLRTGFDNSNVSFSNRIVERHEGRSGGYYLSYDFVPLKLGQPFGSGRAEQADLDAHNINKSPLGPAGTNASNSAAEFLHDGGEVIYMLPNGLFGYYLVNAAGDRIDKGPLSVVRQLSGPGEFNQAITNGLSCMSCHNAGLLEQPDTILDGIGLNRADLVAADISRINRFYQAEAYKERLAEDNGIYVAALKELGIDSKQPDPVDAAYRFYNRPLKRADVIAELGLSERDFNLLLTDPEFSGSLNALNKDGFISRPLFQSLYAGIVKKFKQEVLLARPTKADFVVSTDCMVLDPLKMDDCTIVPPR